MKPEQVGKLTPKERLVYWIIERHKIHLLRKTKSPKPWTDDPILQQFFFTNPYRENDKTTVWFRENIREKCANTKGIAFATVAFRWFNFIPTGKFLLENHDFSDWDTSSVIRRLLERKKEGKQIFTGAYMIKSTTGISKVEGVCRCIENVWEDRKKLVADLLTYSSLQEMHERFLEYPYLGGFMAYEIVTDLRHTVFGREAIDIDTWCNPGPGCKRGLMRLVGETPPKNRFGRQKRGGLVLPSDWQERMQGLREYINKSLLPGMPKFEMREVEHSLCEFDKYERARCKDGKMKRTYQGV